MTGNERAIYVFEGCRLDAGRRLLHRADGTDAVALTPKLVELLLFLVERHGQLVDKRELLETLWPNVVVEENNLTQAISTLRRTLGERPQENRFIATVPGRGYRFVADVAVLAATGDHDAGEHRPESKDSEVIASRKTRSSLPYAIAGFLLILLLVVAGVLGARFMSNDGAPRLVSQMLVTTTPGDHFHPTLSPDGSYVAFVKLDDSNRRQIWVQNLRTLGEPLQITFDDSGAMQPSWSSRNDWIVFESGRGSIDIVGTLGTPPPTTLIERGASPSYSFDGDLIVYESGKEIRTANADGTGQRTVAGVPDRQWAFVRTNPALSPDGTMIAFYLQENGPLGDLWVIPTAGGEARRVTNDLHWAEAPVWTPDGRRLVYPSRRGGTWTLWSVEVDGGVPEPMTSGAGRDADPAVSRDGRRVVYTNRTVESRFVVSDPEAGTSETIHASRNLMAFPNVSPSGRLLAYFSEVEPRERLFVMPLDRSARPRQLNAGTPSQALVMPVWISDERLSFYENLETASLEVISPAGGPPTQLFREFRWEENMWLAWSLDGALAAFVRIDPTNQNAPRVIVREIATGEEWPLDEEMQSVPNWSNDGSSLVGMGRRGIVICPVTGAQCDSVLEGSGISFPRWSNDDSRIFFLQKAARLPSNLSRELRVVDRDGENNRHLMDLGPLHPIGGPFQVLPDDRILWTQHIEGDMQIYRAEIAH